MIGWFWNLTQRALRTQRRKEGKQLVTETGRRLRGKAIDDTLDPVFEVELAEVDQ